MTSIKAIDIVSPLVKDVAAIISAAVALDANKDGKIDLGEGFAFGQMIIVSVLKNYQTIDQAIAQLADADSVERKELVSVFAEGFDLSSDDVEALIEGTIAYLEDTVTKGFELSRAWGSVLVK